MIMKDNCYAFTEAYKGEVKFDYAREVNFAMAHNVRSALLCCELRNNGEKPWRDVKVAIDGEYLWTKDVLIDSVNPGDPIDITKDLNIYPDPSAMMSLTESVVSNFTLTVTIGNEEVFNTEFLLKLMPYDHWLGSGYHPELLAAFVMPNHPMISRVTAEASKFMERWTGSCAMDEYQSGDPNRVRQQVAAIYEALRGEGLIYVTPPANFGQGGQRIRTVDKVLSEKQGTCIDLTLLMASCFEAVGIQPIVVLVQGHAFVGAWLVPDTAAMVGDDAAYLLKRSAEGISDMVFVESTCLTQSGPADFEGAVKSATGTLKDSNLHYYINIAECRHNGIRPIAMRVADGDKCVVAIDTDAHEQATRTVRRVSRYDLGAYDKEDAVVDKYTIWERKLLDFSLNNNLLNMKIGKRILPIVSFNIDRLEDQLQDGHSYRVMPFPLEQAPTPVEGMYDSSRYPQMEEKVAQQIEKDTVFSYLREAELKEALKHAYRASRTSLEENGANNLYLVLGVLKWRETERSTVPRYAPLLLLPIDMTRTYTIRTRDEDIALNITLKEMLRQQHDVDLSALNTLPTDQSGVDVKKILAIVRDKIRDKRGWDVIDEAMIGLFSFSKFVMWNDIHTNRDKLAENAIIASLVAGKLKQQLSEEMTDAKAADQQKQPQEFTIPIDVDSSQLEAIIDSGAGKSFILHGPPGTGKSQTITNMIANALYQGKRVLFVAEKMAALSVVQARLAKIGLEPFCLELHSNKVTKQHFLQQMDKALNVAHVKPQKDYQAKAEELYAKRCQLMQYVEALHAKAGDGLSLYDCITGYLSTPGDKIDVEARQYKGVTASDIENMRAQLEHLDVTLRVTGNPSGNPLEGLMIKDGSAQAEEKLRHAIAEAHRLYSAVGNPQLLENIDAVCAEWNEVNAKWFLPRFFAKKSFLKRHSLDEQGMLTLTEAKAAVDEMRNIADIEVGAADLQQALARWNQPGCDMRKWYMWCKEKGEMERNRLTPAINYIINGGHSGAQAADAFAKGLYYALAMDAINNNEQLRFFNGMMMNELVEAYRKLTSQFQQLSKQELYCRLAANVPQQTMAAVDNSEMGILKRNIKNGGRGTSIRRIIEQIPTLLPKLCPCMLMSPLSVAQYIDLGNEKFDIVIFDEASQMPTSEAVGAIARGKALIVVGDPKQMPPTSFFATSSVGEDEADLDDQESILDDCLVMSIPSKYLTWHYRSKHESLIAFSNTQYYGGHLLTFPSVDDQQRKVQLRTIEGVYQRSGARVNLPEAQAVVQEVMRRLRDPELSKMSIGVVSFSKVQQDKIEDLLTEELAKDHELEARAYDCEEPIFIKNLENVQGDERDVIIFSIGYGPDKTGKVSMNFGPLNKKGGEKRLNVAVSRARYEMIVFSSMKAEHIDLRRTSAEGVEGLKKFLEFAERGNTSMAASSQTAVADDTIARMIADKLRQHGYEVKLGVGRSQFKVDLAVVDADDPNKYLLGIMLDGPAYYATKTVRDREVVQPSVLKLLNWRVMRVWTLDWLERPEQVVGDILVKLSDIKSGKPEPEKPAEEKVPDLEPMPEPTPVTAESPAREYAGAKGIATHQLGSVDELANHSRAILTQVQTIVKQEQPIVSSLLYKRIVKLWGLSRVSPRVQTIVDAALASSGLYRTGKDNPTWWTDAAAAKAFDGYRTSDRDITDVPDIEIENAMRFVIDQQIALDRDSLKRLTANQLGYTRLGANIDAATDRAVASLAAQGYISASPDRVSKA